MLRGEGMGGSWLRCESDEPVFFYLDIGGLNTLMDLAIDQLRFQGDCG